MKPGLDAHWLPPTKKVRDLVYSDRRIQVEEIAQALGISHDSVSTILHDRLGLRKLTARWVPKSLSDEQMATKSVIMLDFLPKRSTITGVYYAYMLDQLRTALRGKRRGKLSKCVLLQQDNARVHTCKVAMAAVKRNGNKLIPHPAYSPDLAPSDFFLFPNLKKNLHGLHFRSDEEVVTAVEEWVNGKDPDLFQF